MKRFSLGALLVLTLAACGGGGGSPGTASTPADSQAKRLYNGTASVGDFLTITIDPAAHTLAYTDRSNGDSGTVPYTVDTDGTYRLADTTGNLLSAYEVPGYAVLIQAAHTGPAHTAPSLVTAVQSGPISLASPEHASVQLHAVQDEFGRLGDRVGDDRCLGSAVAQPLLAVWSYERLE